MPHPSPFAALLLDLAIASRFIRGASHLARFCSSAARLCRNSVRIHFFEGLDRFHAHRGKTCGVTPHSFSAFPLG